MEDSKVDRAETGGEPEGLPSGVLTRVSPTIRRLIADNPGPFTFTGTCSYIVGEGRVAIVDPGPAGQDRHIAALLDAVRGETVSHIVVTHSHRDHSPGARALKAATGTPIVGCGPHRPARADAPRTGGGGLDFGRRSGACPRSHLGGGRRHRRPRLDARRDRNAWPHGQPSDLRTSGGKVPAIGRSRHGLVDDDRSAPRWFDGRLHGLAPASPQLRPCHLLAGPWRSGPRSTALCEGPGLASPSTRAAGPRCDLGRREPIGCDRRQRLSGHRAGIAWCRLAVDARPSRMAHREGGSGGASG